MFQDLLNKRKSHKGMTLLELTISMVIFGILVISINLPLSTGLYLSVDDNNIVKANNIAKTYIKDLENNWKIQLAYDNAELIEVDSTYTDNGKYTVNITSEDIQTNEDGIVVIRRVGVNYKNKEGKTLTDIFYDFNRPGSTAK